MFPNLFVQRRWLGLWQTCALLLWSFCYLANMQAVILVCPPAWGAQAMMDSSWSEWRGALLWRLVSAFSNLLLGIMPFSHTTKSKPRRGATSAMILASHATFLQTLKSDFPKGQDHVRAMPKESLEHTWAKSLGTVNIWLETSNMLSWSCYPKDIAHISGRHLTHVLKTFVFRTHCANLNS